MDLTTNTVTTTINVGTQPIEVALTPDGATAYISNFQSNNVSVIDTTTNTVTATINVTAGPWDIALRTCAPTPTPTTTPATDPVAPAFTG